MIEEVTPWSTQNEYLRAEIPADEVPSDSSTETNPEEDRLDPVIEEGKIQIKKDGKILEILIPDYSIRGQLGSLITSELNELFENHDEKDMSNISGVRIQVQDPDSKALVQESYICLTDISSLNPTHGRLLLDQLVPATEHYKNVSCFIRMDTPPIGSIDLSIETLKDMKVRFFYNKNQLLDYLESYGHE